MPQLTPGCLGANLTDVQKCALSYRVGSGYYGKMVSRDAALAKATGAKLLPTTPFFCKSGKCSPIVKDFIVYVDQDHITILYSDYVAGLMQTALAPLLR